MFHVMYYRSHYYKCMGIQQGGNTSLLLSIAMYLDSGGADENGVVMTSDRRPAMKEDHLLRGTINDVGGIHNKL